MLNVACSHQLSLGISQWCSIKLPHRHLPVVKTLLAALLCGAAEANKV